MCLSTTVWKSRVVGFFPAYVATKSFIVAMNRSSGGLAFGSRMRVRSICTTHAPLS
jgi:hypothetical protein